ncbi:hypothetical protein BDW72DRAFT_187083 [Aspergillus terricola var. indicus]
MHITTSRSKLLALLLFFLSHLTLCVSVPTNSLISRTGSYNKHSYLPNSLLTKRVDEDYETLSEEIAASTYVTQHDQKYLAFGAQPKTLGSAGFTGCLGLVIASTKGAILGHYEANDDGLALANENIPGLIRDNKDALVGAQAWVYVHVRLRKPDQVVAEPYVKQLEELVTDGLGIQAQRVKYIDPGDLLVDEDGELRDDIDDWSEDLMYGSILVKHPGGEGQNAVVRFVHLDWQKSITV